MTINPMPLSGRLDDLLSQPLCRRIRPSAKEYVEQALRARPLTNSAGKQDRKEEG